MEQRRGCRLDTDLGVRFVASPATIGSGRITNISSTGAFMETAGELSLSSAVYIEALDSGKESQIYGAAKRLGATVVRRCSGGVGLEWCAPCEDLPAASQPDAAAPKDENDAADETGDANRCTYRFEFTD